ncbi:MAG: acylhydrolase [Erysipelotrichaceae bacterium]|nr:acylhydrolase [Erysipelotrichaceae bacterium]
MKRILCFGDSNTWGYVPSSDAERYPVSIRYPRVLASLLGNDYEVIEEGLPGRTMCSDDLKELVGNRNGKLAFGGILYSSLPLDYILIMLGSNDLKYIYKDTAKRCAESLEKDYIYKVEQKLVGKIKNSPKIIIVAPSVVGDGYEKVSKDVINESKYFNEEYQKVAEKHNCLFVDNNGLETGSDYIHLTEKSHLLLAKKIYKAIKDYESSK